MLKKVTRFKCMGNLNLKLQKKLDLYNYFM